MAKDIIDKYQFDPYTSNTKDFNQFWAGLKKEAGTDNIVLKDKLETKILFDSNPDPKNVKRNKDYFKTHIFQNKDGREKYAHTFPDIIANPDEVWSYRENKTLIRSYLKFYDDGLYLVYVNEKAGKMVAETMYQLKKERYEEFRIGSLLYKKR